MPDQHFMPQQAAGAPTCEPKQKANYTNQDCSLEIARQGAVLSACRWWVRATLLACAAAVALAWPIPVILQVHASAVPCSPLLACGVHSCDGKLFSVVKNQLAPPAVRMQLWLPTGCSQWQSVSPGLCFWH